MSIVFMKVSATTLLFVLIKSSLATLIDFLILMQTLAGRFALKMSVSKMTQFKVSQKLGTVVLVVKSMLQAETATC